MDCVLPHPVGGVYCPAFRKQEYVHGIKHSESRSGKDTFTFSYDFEGSILLHKSAMHQRQYGGTFIFQHSQLIFRRLATYCGHVYKHFVGVLGDNNTHAHIDLKCLTALSNLIHQRKSHGLMGKDKRKKQKKREGKRQKWVSMECLAHQR